MGDPTLERLLFWCKKGWPPKRGYTIPVDIYNESDVHHISWDVQEEAGLTVYVRYDAPEGVISVT